MPAPPILPGCCAWRRRSTARSSFFFTIFFLELVIRDGVLLGALFLEKKLPEPERTEEALKKLSLEEVGVLYVGMEVQRTTPERDRRLLMPFERDL